MPLAGVRIWLSGAVPKSELSKEQHDSIVEFARQLARKVFLLGGYIVHGSHPSLTPVLLEEAERFHAGNPAADRRLILIVSRFFSRQVELPLDQWRVRAVVLETPEAPTQQEPNRDASLEIMRRWMASRADAVVAVGGESWSDVPGRAGVSKELNLAFERGLPCFLLAGLGGRAASFVEENPRVVLRLRNGLNDEENRRIASDGDANELTSTVVAQLARLPLVKGKGAEALSFRILALDGGGVKGAFTAAVLATWERLTGLRVVEHFDLIAGTSTGGIIALGLALGLSAEEILSFYEKKGSEIFPLTSVEASALLKIRHLFCPKHPQDKLRRELEVALDPEGKKPRMRDSRCRLVIPAYYVTGGSSHIFRTPHHPELTADTDTQTVDVAVATAAAPTYFKAAEITNTAVKSLYFDGGVWANSPVMAAIVEALTFIQVPVERLDVLSIGTTGEPFNAHAQQEAGILRWAKQIVRVLMSAQQEGSLRLAERLVTEPRFLRINPVTVPGRYKLDDPNMIPELVSLGARAASDPRLLGQVKSRFLSGVHAMPWETFP